MVDRSPVDAGSKGDLRVFFHKRHALGQSSLVPAVEKFQVECFPPFLMAETQVREGDPLFAHIDKGGFPHDGPLGDPFPEKPVEKADLFRDKG